MYKVLLVENNQEIAEIIQFYLMKEYETCYAQSAEDALMLINTTKFDVILLVTRLTQLFGGLLVGPVEGLLEKRGIGTGRVFKGLVIDRLVGGVTGHRLGFFLAGYGDKDHQHHHHQTDEDSITFS